jgi:hypothetical protein
MGHEYKQGTVVGLCGNNDPAVLATNIREALAGYYECAGAMVFMALAAGLFFLCWRALQCALSAATKGDGLEERSGGIQQ